MQMMNKVDEHVFFCTSKFKEKENRYNSTKKGKCYESADVKIEFYNDKMKIALDKIARAFYSHKQI
jgi:hypothetical protein